MSARCLRCGAGNEWIEGVATLKAEPDDEAELAAAKAEIEAHKAEHDISDALLKDAQAEIAALRDKPCPHVRTSGTTSWCELARRDSAIKQEQTPGWFDPQSHGRGGI